MDVYQFNRKYAMNIKDKSYLRKKSSKKSP